MNTNIIIKIGAINGFLTVALGAFGAHGLKHQISDRMMDVFQTAIDYHGMHSLALIGLALYLNTHHYRSLTLAAYAFIIGIVLFCGSLYVMALTSQTWLGMITPLGGISFLVGWYLFAFPNKDKRTD